MSKKHITTQPASSSRKAKPSQKARRQNRNLLWIGLGLALLAILTVVFLLKPKTTQSYDISTAQAYQKYQEGAFFLDVRTQAEWEQTHISGSILIPLNELSDHMDELPLDRDMVVVCRSGRRSQKAANTLQQAGYSNTSSMSDGLTAWEAAGYPLESSTP